MKNKWFMIGLLYIFAVLFASVSYGQNVLINSGFETGKTGWKNTGGAFSITSTAPNILIEKQSASFVASAAAQYFESNPYVVPKGLWGGDCMASFLYTGADANGYLTVMDGASVELIPTANRAILNATAGTKTAKVYFTCPSAGSFKLRIQSTAAMVIGYFDSAVIGKSDFQPTKQSAYIGEVTYSSATGNSTASTTFVDFAITSGSGSYSNVIAPTGTRFGFKIPNAPKGRYKIIATGFEPAAASTTTNTETMLSLASTDIPTGTVCGLASASGNTNGATDVKASGAVVCEYENTTDQSNKEFWLKFKATTGTANVFVSGGSRISVYYYPSGTDTVVNSKCPNDIACENEFSAYIQVSGGTVTNTTLNWLVSPCSRTSAGIYVCTFQSGIFTQQPQCDVVVQGGDGGFQGSPVSYSGATSVTVNTRNSSNVISDADFILNCRKTGADFKAKQNIQAFLSSTVTSDNNIRVEKGKYAQATENTNCTSSPCTVYRGTSGVSSVTRSSLGNYVINFFAGTFSEFPNCFFTAANGSSPITSTINAAPTLTSYSVVQSVSNTGAGADSVVDFYCIGRR